MTLDNFVEADILATCNALGSEIKGVYEKGNDCIECLKDILRYLKRDSESHGILRYLGSIRLLQTDLLPILKRYDKNAEIFDFTLRILVALTNPALLLYKEDLPDDKMSRNLYLQIISFLQSYKKAFTDVSVWKILYEHLKDMLKVRPIERSTDENLIVERIIILIRNVLHVPPDESVLKQTDEDLSLHDKVLWSLHESNIEVLLLYMAANEEEHQYCLHTLEIISLMLREHTSEMLACSNETRTDAEKQKDLNILLAARQREHNLKLQTIQTVCKSRFNGVYCVKNMKSISDNDYIAHKLITNIDDVKFDLQKSGKCRPKNRVRALDVNNTRHSTLNIRMFLKNFCSEFLKAYNKLMVSVKRELMRKVSDEHDETYYLWAVCYFMQFNRMSDFQSALVSETISKNTFHHIQTEITNYQEMMLTDKKKQLFWAKRMKLGVSAYKELLETLRRMEKSQDDDVRGCADALVSHVFYVIEYREMLLSLLTHYDEVKFPLSYLAELVESTQLFLKMLENHSKKHSEIIVQKKQRKVNRRRKKKPVVASEPVNEEDQLDQQWNAIASELSACVLGKREIPDVTPFDGASNMTFEEQKVEAVYKIREAIIANEPLDALGLLRAARELWPDGDSFGVFDIEPEPEFLILREIHFSNLKKDSEENSHVDTAEILEEEDEEIESMPLIAEQQLDLNDVYKKYASPKVVQPCSFLLANYKSNKPQTNICLVKLLHRIAWNCKMHALFFQSTIFLTFQKIFRDPDSKQDPTIKELYRFAKFIVQRFFSAVEKNNKIFVEFLFWKGTREAYELEEGYGVSEKKNKGWTEDDEEELKYLFDVNRDICIEGQDVADIILANFNKDNRTKPQIISALKRLGLIKSAKELKPEKRSEWIEAEIAELQHLFEDYKTSSDVMSNILEKLSIKRSRKAVVDKLLELNLIQDRKEVRKKGLKKKKSQSGNSDDDDDVSDENDEIVDNDREVDERNHSNFESSDEDEVNFFKNLEAERIADSNSAKETAINENGLDSLSVPNPLNNKNNRKNSSTVWKEEEVMELTSLFHENQGSGDIMQVLNALTIKRSEQAIVEKLFELGLIKDKKDIRKKKNSKSKNGNMLGSKFDGMDDESNSSSIEQSSSNKQNKMIKDSKKAKLRILSDSSDEDNDSAAKLKNKDVSQESKKKKAPKVWEEQEAMELTTLFHANEGSSDIMHDLLKALTVKRSKQAVIEKLLELGLIQDKKEVRKKRETKSKKNAQNASNLRNNDAPHDIELSLDVPKSLSEKRKRAKQHILSDSSDEDVPLSRSSFFGKNKNNAETSKNKDLSSQDAIQKRPSKFWEEQDVMELTSLFHQNQGSNNIMNVLLNALTVKRPKQGIVEKLLELGLIKDKKEIRKKREPKSKIDVSNSGLSNKLQDTKGLSDSEPAGYASNGSLSKEKKGRRRILSDSSDDDVLHNEDSSIPIGSEFVENEKQQSQAHKRKRNILSSDDSSADETPMTNIDEHDFGNNIIRHTILKTKRKLYKLDDSEDESS